MYARVVLAFSAVSVLVLYAFQRVQDQLPLILGFAAGQAATSAWNTAVSFVTNTNWQSYSGEADAWATSSQMAGLTVQNFVSAAVGHRRRGRAGARASPASSTDRLGNFWVDLVRGVRPHPAARSRRSPRSC